MPEELREIKFDNNYPKIHGQNLARLVMVIQEIPGEMLLTNFEFLTFFDTMREDGKFYDIDPEKQYMLLLFIGDKNIMFPTLRKQNSENAILYAESVGELFRITIESKGENNGREQGHKRENC